jgi:predicted small metal-binding protein
MVEKSVASCGSLVGACAWMVSSRGIDDYDGYTVYHPREGPGNDLATNKRLDKPEAVAELKRFSASMRKPVVRRPGANKPPPKGKDAEVRMRTPSMCACECAVMLAG